MNLVGITLLYFALPLLIFVITFVSPVLSVVLTTLLAVSVYLTTSTSHVKEKYSHKEISTILLSSFVFTLLSGAGNLLFQNSDWLKHNAILYTLIDRPWPVVFAHLQDGARNVFLNYYLGWYMVPALIGKLSGGIIWTAAFVQFVYTFLGVALTFLWLKNILGKMSIFHIVFFILFATADTAGIILLGKSGLINLVTPIEGWSIPGLLEYSSFTTLLFWVPGQAIAGWILTALVLKAIQDKRYVKGALVILPLTAFWSPFAVIGALPFFLFMIFSNVNIFKLIMGSKSYRKNLLSRDDLILTVASLLLLAFFGLYYLSNLGSTINGGMSLTLSRLVSEKELVRFALFYIFEALIPAIILFFYYLGTRSASRQEKSKNYAYYLVASSILIALPFLKLGINNDLLMRASIPALFVLYYSTVKYFSGLDIPIPSYLYKPYKLYELYKLIPLLIALYFLLGTITPITEISRTVRGSRSDFAKIGIDKIGTKQMQLQYMGKDLWIMKK